MSCQKNSNEVCQSAVFAGVPAKTSKFAFALGTAGAGLGALNAVQSFRKFVGMAWDGESGAKLALQAAWTVTMAICTGVNAMLTRDSYRNLQERKKTFTKHVIVDAKGNEIGWTYNPGTAKDQLKMHQKRGARVLQVQEKIDFGQVRQSLQEKDFQQVEKA